MELPCEICAVKTPPKSKLIEISGRCFMRSASVLFDTALGKGSIPGIALGLMLLLSIDSAKLWRRGLECWGLWTWVAASKNIPMFYHWIVPSESFTWHELTALLGTPLVDGHMEKKLAYIQKAMYSIGALVSYWLWRPNMVRRAFFIRMAFWLRVVRVLLFMKWVWVDPKSGWCFHCWAEYSVHCTLTYYWGYKASGVIYYSLW
jgi:hypothetical protein